MEDEKHSNAIAQYEIKRLIDFTMKIRCISQQENIDRCDQPKVTCKLNDD